MLHDKWPTFPILVAAYVTAASATEELQNSSPFQTLGSGLRDIVLRTFTLCGTEILGLQRETSEANQVRNSLCKFLLKPHSDTARGHYGAPAYNTYV
jgi:hypothetical protein